MTDRRAACILFLDFDGVTHPDPCEMGRLFIKLPLIEAVLRRFDDCKIVISSSWRVVHPLDEMRGFFAVDMQSRVIGMTPQQRFAMGILDLQPGYSRQWECEAWLSSQRVWLPHERRLDAPWIAIDDRHDWFRADCKNLLATNSRMGFTSDDAIRLERMLGERIP
jgi:hypothetical protein